MTSVNTSLRAAIEELITHDSSSERKYLMAKPSKEGCVFSCVRLSTIARLWRELGFGDAAAKNTAKALLEAKGELMSLADGMWDKGEQDKVLLADRAIEEVFAEAGMRHQAIDLFGCRYSTWMQKLPAHIKKRQINHICLPSTHDSGAYKIDWELPIVNSTVAKAAKMLPCLQSLIASWTLTQTGDIASQLKKGIRCFDLRLSYNESSGEFYLTHTFTCDRLELSLKAVKDFLASNTQEVLVIAMKPDWEHRESFYPNADKLEKVLMSHLGGLLYPPPKDGKLPTLSNMIENNQRVLAIWTDETVAVGPSIWSYSTYETHWCNTSNLEEKVEYLQSLLKKIPDSTTSFYDFSITLTPQVSDIVISIFERVFTPWTEPRSLQTLTRLIQHSCQQFFETEKGRLRRTSLVVTDFPYNAFVYQVVFLNYKNEANKTGLPKAPSSA